MASRPCVFISGAASGIGRAAAQLFAERGWFVGLADVDEAGVQALATTLGQAQCLALSLDVRSPEAWRSALAAFFTATGRLDVLVNNAGILISGPLEASALERHHAVLDINVKGVLHGCHVAKPYLQATPGSRVINLSSAAAVYGQAALATYSASKFAVRAFTEALNIEWEKDGIRVMDVMPLFVQTAMVHNMDARSMDRMGVHLTAQDVARTLYRAATYRGSFGKVHWPVGFMARWLFRLTALGPDRLSRWVASRLAA